LLYGSENWTIKARDTRRITAAEMKYMRKIAECTWIDYIQKNTDCKGTKYNPSFGQNIGILKNWLQRITRMPHNRLPRIIKNCRPKAEETRGDH
jgi:hypothetical protein